MEIRLGGRPFFSESNPIQSKKGSISTTVWLLTPNNQKLYLNYRAINLNMNDKVVSSQPRHLLLVLSVVRVDGQLIL